MSPTELAKVAGISPYVADKAAAAQRKLSIDELKSAFSASADCERDIKTGRLAGEPAVERLIYRVAAEAKVNQYPAS
jgi:DNA polymerase III delta subunit